MNENIPVSLFPSSTPNRSSYTQHFSHLLDLTTKKGYCRETIENLRMHILQIDSASSSTNRQTDNPFFQKLRGT